MSAKYQQIHELAPVGNAYPKIHNAEMREPLNPASQSPPTAAPLHGVVTVPAQPVPVGVPVASAPPLAEFVPHHHSGVYPAQAARDQIPVAVLYQPHRPQQLQQPPFQQPPPLAQPQGEMVRYVPPVPTAAEFKSGIENRVVQFQMTRYFAEARLFLSKNYCAMAGVTLLWLLLGVGITVLVAMLTYSGFEALGVDMSSILDCDMHQWKAAIQNATATAKNSSAHVNWWDEVSNGSFDGVFHNMMLKLIFWGVIQFIVMLWVIYPATGSYCNAVFNAIRNNRPVKFCDFFSAYRCPLWCKLCGVCFIVTCLTNMFSLLLIVPGVWFSVASVFAIPLAVEQKHLDMAGTVSTSVKVVNRNWCNTFCFLMCLIALNCIGLFTFGVTLVFTLPFSLIAYCYAYNHQIGINSVPVMVPVEHLAGVTANPVAVAPINGNF